LLRVVIFGYFLARLFGGVCPSLHPDSAHFVNNWQISFKSVFTVCHEAYANHAIISLLAAH
jgi:hypothetical protein